MTCSSNKYHCLPLCYVTHSQNSASVLSVFALSCNFLSFSLLQCSTEPSLLKPRWHFLVPNCRHGGSVCTALSCTRIFTVFRGYSRMNINFVLKSCPVSSSVLPIFCRIIWPLIKITQSILLKFNEIWYSIFLQSDILYLNVIFLVLLLLKGMCVWRINML